MTKNNALPLGWILSTIGEICETTSGGTPSRKVPSYYGGDIPWLKSGELGDKLIYDIEEFITDDGLQNSSAKIFPEGTLLIALYGATVGRLGILGIDAATNQAICALFPPENLDKKFLFWFLRKQRDELLKARIGGAQPNISQTILRAVEIPIPPLPEQERIVAKIEELFTQLDAGVAELHYAKAQLQRYRQAVLKSAVEGELTSDWRQARRIAGDSPEPAAELLARILSERRAKWEAEELAKLRAKGKEPKNDKWKAKYKEPATPDTDGLPELPEGWVWVSLDQLLWKIEAGKSFKAEGRPAKADESGVIKVSAMSWGNFLPDENKALYPDTDVSKSSSVKAGDLLISRANTVELVGAVVLVEHDFPNLFLSDKSLRLILTSKEADKRYILYSLRSQWVRNVYERLATGTSDSMRNLSQPKIRSAPIALPSTEEQKRIADKLERRLSVADEIKKELDQALARSERLRQSILKRAFEGRLV